jgi:hypothetical protein
MALPKSKLGLTLVIVYLGFAAFFDYLALTHSDYAGFFPAIPFGLVYLGILQWLNPIFQWGSLTYAPFRNWWFIVPTTLGNVIVYYWLGIGISHVYRRVARSPRPPA